MRHRREHRSFRRIIALVRGKYNDQVLHLDSVRLSLRGESRTERVLTSTGALEMGVDELSLGDTIGVATPNQVVDMIDLRVHDGTIPMRQIAVHFHDTRGTALANVLMALECGISIVDSSAGGFGGCPYAPGAAGNLATEDLLYMLHGMGIHTGVDLDKVVAATNFINPLLGHPATSKYYQAAISAG